MIKYPLNIKISKINSLNLWYGGVYRDKESQNYTL